ncbi:MAG: PQQ-binding-like beta-propeller repeat protein [Thaumarchaeota archaeon]|nr:PQQ-binding-like beta-propeller repeat protein [Nitrososphaerota archaeon]
MSSTSKIRLSLLSIIVILSFSTILPAFVYAVPTGTNNGKDWMYTDGDSWAQNYTPETQITKSNVNSLEVKWLFPIESKSTAQAAIQGVALEGSTTPPIVRNGTVYVATQYGRTYAIDAETGALRWKYDYVIDLNATAGKLPIEYAGILPGIGLTAHMHGFRFWEKGNAVLLNGLACDVYGIDANTGKQSFWVQNLCANIPGNIYKYRQGAVSTTNIGTYEKGRQFITVQPGAMHSYIYGGDARHTTTGVSMDAPYNIVWRIFSYPPQDKATKDWATQECDIGYFQTMPCTEAQAKAPANLEWDWAQPNEPPNQYGGVTANWGEVVVDEDTGMAYTQTGNQGPYTYVGTTPGPRLYGSTIMAIDLNKGQRAWWLQPFPRDPYDYDCNWSGVLADVQGLGKVYMKGCKEGRLYVMNATNGKPLYVNDVVNEMVSFGQIGSSALKEPYQGGVRYHLTNITSHYDIREMVSPDNSTYCGRPCPLFPNFFNGVFGTDMSYDPETGILYHYATALQTIIVRSLPAAPGVNTAITTGNFPTNTTIVARDVKTGNITWKYYYPFSQQRAAMVITPELVFAGFTDGYLRFFDKSNGQLLREMNLGSNLQIQFTTGQDSKGDQKIFGLLGVSSTFAPSTPGTLVAIGLSKQAAANATATTTVTTTSATTITSTTTSVSVSTTTAAATTITSTVPATTTTIISTLPGGQTTTITSTIPAQTITTTIPGGVTTITSPQAGGLPVEVTYAAIAIAIIAIIAAVVLATRRRV